MRFHNLRCELAQHRKGNCKPTYKARKSISIPVVTVVRIQYVSVGTMEELRSEQLESFGFKPLDALHIACAENANADILLTTDKRMLRRSKNYYFQLRVRVENPHIWLEEVLPMNVREIREVSMEENQCEDTELRALLGKIFQHKGGKGDYSIERHEWVDSLDLDTILKGIQELRDTEQKD